MTGALALCVAFYIRLLLSMIVNTDDGLHYLSENFSFMIVQ